MMMRSMIIRLRRVILMRSESLLFRQNVIYFIRIHCLLRCIMKKQFTYEIEINPEMKSQEVLEFSFLCHIGNNSPKQYSFLIGKQYAKIRYLMSKKPRIEDVVNKSAAFKEAIRKSLLLHVINNAEGLLIERIILCVNSERTVFTNENDNFPFVFSMLDASDLQLPDSWRNGDFIQSLIIPSTSQHNNDPRFAALASFLLSRCRKQFYIEQFSSLWTAMNAYYNFIGSAYEKRLLEEINDGRTKKIKFKDLQKQKINLTRNDSSSISTLMYLQKPGTKKPSENEEKDAVKAKMYDSVAVLLQKLSQEEIEELYSTSLRALFDQEQSGLSDRYKAVQDVANHFQMPTYSFLLLQYPYYWRCNYFHGNKPTTIISCYNDRSIAVLRTINYFLDSFLCDEIPKLLRDDFFDDNFYANVKRAVNNRTNNGINRYIATL